MKVWCERSFKLFMLAWGALLGGLTVIDITQGQLTMAACSAFLLYGALPFAQVIEQNNSAMAGRVFARGWKRMLGLVAFPAMALSLAFAYAGKGRPTIDRWGMSFLALTLWTGVVWIKSAWDMRLYGPSGMGYYYCNSPTCIAARYATWPAFTGILTYTMPPALAAPQAYKLPLYVAVPVLIVSWLVASFGDVERLDYDESNPILPMPCVWTGWLRCEPFRPD